MSEGIQIRQMFYVDPEHPKDPCMVQLHVWPLPQEHIEGLLTFLKQAAVMYLQEAQLTNGNETDLHGPGGTAPH